VQALEQVLGVKLQVSPQAHFAGAIGAALFALEKMDQGFESGVWSAGHAADSRN
jgi:activator of 2-hydroxyglutaryl-CoA dehydratase